MLSVIAIDKFFIEQAYLNELVSDTEPILVEEIPIRHRNRKDKYTMEKRDTEKKRKKKIEYIQLEETILKNIENGNTSKSKSKKRRSSITK